jgi:hypothetical protein
MLYVINEYDQILGMQNHIRKILESSANVFESYLQKSQVIKYQCFYSETLTPLLNHLQKKKKSSAGYRFFPSLSDKKANRDCTRLISYVAEIKSPSNDAIDATQVRSATCPVIHIYLN